jgi:hypothetical protein
MDDETNATELTTQIPANANPRAKSASKSTRTPSAESFSKAAAQVQDIRPKVAPQKPQPVPTPRPAPSRLRPSAEVQTAFHQGLRDKLLQSPAEEITVVQPPTQKLISDQEYFEDEGRLWTTNELMQRQHYAGNPPSRGMFSGLWNTLRQNKEYILFSSIILYIVLR